MSTLLFFVASTFWFFGAGSGPPTPTNGYVAEDGTTFYVAEDGTTFYVQEV